MGDIMAQLLRFFCFSIFIGLLIVGLAGCKRLQLEGSYQGSYVPREVDGLRVDPVRIEVHSHALHHYQITVQDLKDHPVLELGLYLRSVNQIMIHLIPVNHWVTLEKVPSPQVPPQASLLSKPQTCYEGVVESSQKVQFCLNSELFSLHFFDQGAQVIWSLSGRKFSLAPEMSLETPHVFTLSEALSRALSQGFGFQTSLQQLMNAQHAAHAAWLNLIPSLGTALIWNAEPGYVSAIATAQALTPFLLPSKWLRAKQASRDARAVQAAQWIVQANLAAQVEQLSYALDRDVQVVKAYGDVLTLLESYINDLDDPVSSDMPFGELGGLGDSTQDAIHILSVIDWVQSLKEIAEKTYQEDQYALALALGFKNPEAIERVDLGEDPRDYEGLELLDRRELARWGVERSFELEQINDLIEGAQQRRKEVVWMWLDPTADSTFNLGPQLIAQAGVAQSRLDQLRIKKEEIYAQLLQDAYRVSREWNQSVLQMRKHDLRRKVLKEQELDLKGWILDQVSHHSLDSESLKKRIQLYLSHELERKMDWASFHIAESKKNRILLIGSFERLLPALSTQSQVRSVRENH
jgi:hypothetical protein